MSRWNAVTPFRSIAFVALSVALLVAASGAAQAAGAAPTYPPGEPGRHAAAWFEAYNAGEAAMRSFIAEHVAPEGLKRRPLEARLDIYHQMRDEHGALTPVRVSASGDASVTVEARAEKGPVLSIEFVCEDEAPHGFLSLLVQEAEEEDAVGAGGRQVVVDRRAPVGPPLKDSEVTAGVTAAADSLAKAGAFSGAFLLARGETTLERRAYGLADREAKRANRPETKFNLGSINKIFTHVAILQLAEQGKLRLTDTIDRYLPDYPKEKGSKITIAMLLEHRGGTGDIFRGDFGAKRLGFKSIPDWYAYVRDLPLDFEPGTKRAYSNAGFVLLGAIIESVSGIDYYRYVRERIFEPAGMKNTDSYANDARATDRAIGYTKSGERNDTSLPARGSSAGGGYSTVEDLARFASALRDGKLLGPENTASLVGALGIAGGSPGVNAALEVLGPYTLVVLANCDPPAAERVASKARPFLQRAEGVRAADDRALDMPGHSEVPDEGVEVPMTSADHLPAVDVMVNGKGPFHFAIDTGGGGTARVDSAFAAAMGLPVVGEVLGGDPSGKNRRRMDVVAIDSLSIGGARFAGLRAAVRSYKEGGRLHGVDGVLGFGLFAGSTVTFDYPAGRLRLESTALPPVDGKRVLAYTDDDGIPSIHIQVDSLDMVAHVDAGSMGGFILPDRAIIQLPLAGEPKVIGRARTVSNTFEIKGAPLKGTLRIGDLEFTGPMLEFQPIFENANVGSRVLKDFRVSFDTKNKRIRFARAS